MGGNDHAAVDEQVGHFHRRNQQAARIPAEIDDQAPHARPVQSPEGVFEVPVGGLLEAGELEVGNALSIGENLDFIDAGDFDSFAADAHAARRAVGGGDRQFHNAVRRPLQQVGGAIGGKTLATGWPLTATIRSRSKIPARLAGLLGMTWRITRVPSWAFSSTPRPTKLPSIWE